MKKKSSKRLASIFSWSIRNLMLLALITVLVIQVIGGLLYFIQFDSSLSSFSSDWANFATFQSYFLTWANLILIGLISYIAHQATLSFNRLQIKPIVYVFIEKPTQINNGFKDSWYLKNGAKNVALNVMVRFKIKNLGNTKWVQCFSLSENEKLELFWIQFAEQIEIAFSDLSNEKYYLFSVKDYVGSTNEISAGKFEEYLNASKENRKYNYISLRDKLEKYFSDGLQNQIEKNELIKNYSKDFIEKHLIPTSALFTPV